MKISNSFFIKQNFIKNNTQKNLPVIKMNRGMNTNANSMPLNAGFYLAYNNVSFGRNKENDESGIPFFVLSNNAGNAEKVFSEIILDSGEKVNLTINKDIIDIFLKTKDGDIDVEVLQKFISVYKAVLQDIAHKNYIQKDFLTSIIEGRNKCSSKTNITYLKPEDEAREALLASISKPEEDFIFSFFNGINNEQTKIRYASLLLGQIGNNPQLRNDKAMQRAICLFNICKNKDGYDFTGFEKKMEIVTYLEDLQQNYGGIDYENLSNDIIDASKDENGYFNSDFARALCETIKNTDVFDIDKLVPHRCSILTMFTDIDKEHTKQIMDSIVNLSAIFSIDDSSNSFESIFAQSFNPVTEKFDETAFKMLMEITKRVNDFTEDFPVETMEDYVTYVKLRPALIGYYFELIRDKNTGNIKSDAISPEEFLIYYNPDNFATDL